MSFLQAISASDLVNEIQTLYKTGMKRGDTTGWSSIDDHYTVVPGQMTIVTGIPGHGKSEWLDALSTNLALGGWKFVVFSPENQPHELHLSKLIEKFCKKSFSIGKGDRIDAQDLAIAIGCLDMSYRFLKVDAQFVQQPSIQSVIHAASQVFQKWIDQGEEKLGLIIDPWNEMDHGRSGNLSETEYISQTLSFVRQFARDWNVHIWLVAHPTKLQKDKEGKYPVPTLYDISGSAHWRNKADNGIVIHRDVMAHDSSVDVHIQKIRFKHIGRPGTVSLFYDKSNGCYEQFGSEMHTKAAANDKEIEF